MPTSHTMELPRQIVVGEKNIDRVGKFLESLSKPKKVSIVSGKNVKKIIGKKIDDSLKRSKVRTVWHLATSNQVNILKDIEKRERSAIQVSKKIKAKSIKFLRNQNFLYEGDFLLNLTKEVYGIISKISPTIIYTHSAKDLNRDHRICNEIVLTATRPTTNFLLEKLITFEIPSSTEWSHGTLGNFTPNYFVNITNYFKKKLQLLKLYNYELRPSPHPRSIENLIAQAKLTGSISGFKYSEKFEIIKILNK